MDIRLDRDYKTIAFTLLKEKKKTSFKTSGANTITRDKIHLKKKQMEFTELKIQKQKQTKKLIKFKGDKTMRERIKLDQKKKLHRMQHGEAKL